MRGALVKICLVVSQGNAAGLACENFLSVAFKKSLHSRATELFFNTGLVKKSKAWAG